MLWYWVYISLRYVFPLFSSLSVRSWRVGGMRSGNRVLMPCVLGLVLGGAWGLKEGMQRPLGSSSSLKLRINSILNACTRRGSFLGNNLGILGASPASFWGCLAAVRGADIAWYRYAALFYNGVNSSIDAYRGKHDTYGAIAAGALSGVIYKATGTPCLLLPLLPRDANPASPRSRP